MPLSERLARFTWSQQLLFAWAAEVVLIAKVFPPSFIRTLILPVFPSKEYFVFYAALAIAYVAVLFFFLLILAVAWSVGWRPFVEPARQLTIVQGCGSPKAPLRRLGEFVVHNLHYRSH